KRMPSARRLSTEDLVYALYMAVLRMMNKKNPDDEIKPGWFRTFLFYEHRRLKRQDRPLGLSLHADPKGRPDDLRMAEEGPRRAFAAMPTPFDGLRARLRELAAQDPRWAVLNSLSAEDANLVLRHGADRVPFAKLTLEFNAKAEALKKRYHRAMKDLRSAAKGCDAPGV